MAESDANSEREASSGKSRCFDSVFSFKGMKVSVQRVSQVNRHCSNEMKYLICEVIYKKKKHQLEGTVSYMTTDTIYNMCHIAIYLLIFIDWIYSIHFKDTADTFCMGNLEF